MKEAQSIALCERTEIHLYEWEEYIRFLLEEFPQTSEGKVRYIIEGGAAVSLINPMGRPLKPHDIDVLLCEDNGLGEAIKSSNPLWYDVHTIPEWFYLRNIFYTPAGDVFLRTAASPVSYQGDEIIILDPAVLAASKTYHYNGQEDMRPKDLCDIVALNISSDEIDLVRKKLEGRTN